MPDKAYRLAGFGRRFKLHSGALENDILVCYPALHRNNLAGVRQDSDGLLTELDRGKYAAITARPRPMARYVDHSSDVEFIKQPGIQVDSGKANIEQLIAKSRLVVHLRVPSTTFLECIFIDHPVIGIYFNLAPTEMVVPFYDFFFKVGVLHRHGGAARKHLNNVRNIKGWWADVTSCREYLDFKNKFCRSYNRN